MAKASDAEKKIKKICEKMLQVKTQMASANGKELDRLNKEFEDLMAEFGKFASREEHADVAAKVMLERMQEAIEIMHRQVSDDERVVKSEEEIIKELDAEIKSGNATSDRSEHFARTLQKVVESSKDLTEAKARGAAVILAYAKNIKKQS